MTRRRILVLFLAFLATLIGATWLVLRETGISRAYLQQVLAHFVRPELLVVEGANVDLGQGSVRFRFTIPNPRGKDLPPLLTAREVHVSMNTNPLGEVGAVHTVRVRGLSVDVNLIEGEALALDEVLALPQVQAHPQFGRKLPAIMIEDSTVTLRIAKDAPPLSFTNVNLQLLPEEGGGSRMVLSGSMQTPLGSRVHVRGTGDPAKDEYRAVAEAEDVVLQPQLAHSFSPALERWLGDAGLAGRAHKMALWVESPSSTADADGKPSGGISIEVADLSCKPPDLPYPLQHATGRASATTRGGGTINFELAKAGPEGDLKARGVVRGVLQGAPVADVRLSLADMLVRPELAEAVCSQAPARQVWEAFAPSAGRTSAELRLWNDRPGQPLRVAMDLALHGVTASFEGFPATAESAAIRFPYPLQDIHGAVQLRGRTLSIQDVRGVAAAGGALAIRGRVAVAGGGDDGARAAPHEGAGGSSRSEADATWLEIDADDIAFDAALRRAIEAFMPEAGAIYDEYDPRGRTDVRLRLRDEPTGSATSGSASSGIVTGGSAAPGAAGGGKNGGDQPDGRRAGSDEGSEGRGDDSTNPTGPGGETEYVLQIRPRGASACYRGFPYRIDEVGGLVEISNRGVTLDLDGSRGGAAIRVAGRFLRPATAGASAGATAGATAGAEHAPKAANTAGDDEPAMRSELWIDGRQLRLDADLRAALAVLGPSMDETWRYLSPTGLASCQLTMWREPPAADFSYDLRIDVADGSAMVQDFELPLENLHGSIFVHGTGPQSRADVHTLRGCVRNEPGSPPATLLLHGRVVDDGSGRGNDIDLTTVVRGLHLHDDLARALDRNGAFSRRAWDVLRPSGTVDVVARLLKAPGEERPHQRLRVQLRGVNSDAAMLPAPAIGLRGELVVVDGNATFEDVRGEVAGAAVVCERGTVRHEPDASLVSATVSAESFPVDDRLANMMTGPLRQTWLDRAVRGRVAVHELQLAFRFPDDGSPFSADFAGQFAARDVRMLLAAPVEEINGIWRVRRGRVAGDGGTVEGDLQDLSFRIFGHQVNEFAATFRADAEAITLDDLSLRLHGGIVRGGAPSAGRTAAAEEPETAADGGVSVDSSASSPRLPRAPALRYALGEPGVLSGTLTFEGLSLSRLLAAGSSGDSPMRGTVAGHLQLDRLAGNDVVDASGNGALRISDGDLGEVPLFAAIYEFLMPKNRPRFDAAAVEFDLRDRRLNVPRFELRSPLMQLTGSGAIGMDGYMDLVIELPNLFGSSADWLVLPMVLRQITGNMLRFQLYGWLREPRLMQRWLGRGEPERAPMQPIAPELPPYPHQRF